MIVQRKTGKPKKTTLLSSSKLGINAKPLINATSIMALTDKLSCNKYFEVNKNKMLPKKPANKGLYLNPPCPEKSQTHP